MQLTEHINGQAIDVTERQSVARDDIDMRTALFQRVVQNLMHIDPDSLREIAINLVIVHKDIELVASDLVVHFRNETHFRRRNKLQDRVGRAISNRKKNPQPIAGKV